MSKLQKDSIQCQAVSERTRRALDAIKNQFPVGDPLHMMHANVKKIIDDTFIPLDIQREREQVTFITFAQLFHELLTPLENPLKQDVKFREKHESTSMPILTAFDSQRTSKKPTDIPILILPSSSANQSKIPQPIEKSKMGQSNDT